MNPRQKHRTLDFYLELEDSEISIIRQKAVLRIWILYTLLVVLSLFFGLVGYQGARASAWKLISVIRFFYLSIALLNMYLIRKNHIRHSEYILITVSMFSIVSNFLIGYDQNNTYTVLTVLTSSILPIQLVHLFVGKNSYRLLLNIAVLSIFYLIGYHVLNHTPESELSRVKILYLISSFIFFMIIFPSYIGSYLKNQLDKIILKKSLYDDHTGLKNRIMFTQDLTDTLNSSHMNEQVVVVYGVYITKFERIIEKEGFDYGNKILKIIGERLQSLQDDFDAYKISGTLFGLIPKRSWDYRKSEKVISLVNDVFSSPVQVGNELIEIPFLIVGTESPVDGRSAQKLLSNLFNTALQNTSEVYKSSSIKWFDLESHKLAERSFIIENGLRSMISNEEYVLVIQPKVNLSDGKIHGGEFLSRWSHPSLGVISPMEFVPLLEENGLLIDFTKSIALKIISFCNELKTMNIKKLVFAVNVSALSLKQPDFIDFLIDSSRKLSPNLLEIELTEDVFMQINADLSSKLAILKEHRIGLALDDFGTGFSNMGYLQDLNVDSIKIDKKFITPLNLESNSYGIVKALIDMGHNFDLDVVAEGVETTDQLDILKELKCDIIQGYLYHKPMHLGEFKQLILAERPLG